MLRQRQQLICVITAIKKRVILDLITEQISKMREWERKYTNILLLFIIKLILIFRVQIQLNFLTQGILILLLVLNLVTIHGCLWKMALILGLDPSQPTIRRWGRVIKDHLYERSQSFCNESSSIEFHYKLEYFILKVIEIN